MRCYMCDGRGMRYDGFQNLYRTCERCGGSGIAEPLTNEEWLRQASTEELAEFIRKQRDDWSDGWYSDCHRFSEIVEWLKQPHKENG